MRKPVFEMVTIGDADRRHLRGDDNLALCNNGRAPDSPAFPAPVNATTSGTLDTCGCEYCLRDFAIWAGTH